MPNTYFRFKKFTVRQDKCAMKIGTDGVLLGAWADITGCRRILDVGTGTGLIALMLAQRCSDAIIDAVEIDEDACIQASENIAQSPFNERINIIRESFTEYETPEKYDLIVSNPPYFVSSLKSPDARRNMARHNDSLTLNSLIIKSLSLLRETGSISLILPFLMSQDLDFIIASKGLFINRRTDVVTVEGQPPKRFLTSFSQKRTTPYLNKILTLEEANHCKTDDYKSLTKDFMISLQ